MFLIAGMSLKSIAKKIQSCKKCPLWKSRTKAVPGEGPANAKLFFIGQAPGREEDRTGRPFVGKAGKFLDELFKKNKINRKKVFITSVVKCFPPKNRAPKKKECETCIRAYLLAQINAVNPKKIVIMGNIPEKILKDKLKGRNTVYTYHPAAGMRFPKIRKKMIQDFKKVIK